MLQALVVLGHVLQNDMNPRAAWVLIRLALSVGLHHDDYSTIVLSSFGQDSLR
jgi:hypothetical protein